MSTLPEPPPDSYCCFSSQTTQGAPEGSFRRSYPQNSQPPWAEDSWNLILLGIHSQPTCRKMAYLLGWGGEHTPKAPKRPSHPSQIRKARTKAQSATKKATGSFLWQLTPAYSSQRKFYNPLPLIKTPCPWERPGLCSGITPTSSLKRTSTSHVGP